MRTADPRIQGKDRFELFDVLRGVAILGIFIVNLQIFAKPMAVYMNPANYGSLEGIDGLAWLLMHIFFDAKFITLFSLLFGAGLVVAGRRAKEAERSAWARHLRRSLILLVVGLAHGYLLWSGDILAFYALCGFLVFALRRAGPKTQFIVGTLVFLVVPLIYSAAQVSLEYMPEEELAAMKSDWAPPPETMAAEVAAFQGGWDEQQPLRLRETFSMHTEALLFYMLWRVSGVMLMGMALLQWGVLNGQRRPRFYAWQVGICLPLGLALVAYGANYNWTNDFSFETTFFGGSLYNYFGSLLMALGYIGIVGLIVTTQVLPALRARLAAVGRLALTCYLGQTLIATTLFYGHGVGLFGQVSRTGLWGVFLAVTILQLLLAPIWLKHFRQGPLEYLLRAGVYLKLPPFRRRVGEEA